MRNDQRLELLELLIFKMINVPYRWGGDDPMTGFDCSGGVLELLKSIGLWLSKQDGTAQTIYDTFAHVDRAEILHPNDDPSLGCLCFYGKSLDKLTHIGMAMDGGELMFEFGGGDEKTTTIDAAIKQNAYGRIRPIDHRPDLRAILRPLRLKP